uniref:Protein kinase domain-containing protein n=1 Tax=Daphnia galeata TaxID=27404 RepID=A0A8J2RWW6_9CRUS|nr:unnamed protein product [Daphnia galeata]
MVIKVINQELKCFFERDSIVGDGAYGTVFRGSFMDQEVAVKRIDLTKIQNPLDLREETHLTNLEHDNIVKFFYTKDDDDFRYLVFELCCGENLHDYCKEKYTGVPIPSELEVLLQLTEGLKYIHSKDIIHRDIKPENILFSKTNPVVMKWADFGLSKLTNSRGSASVSGARGTRCWVPKEIIPFLRRERGVHPFGDDEYDDSIIHKNIVNGNIVNQSSLDDGHFGKDVVIQMIEDRIELSKVIEGLSNPATIKKESNLLVKVVDQTKLIPGKSSSSTEESSAVLARIIFQENIIPIADLLQGKRKKSGWAIKARVIGNPSISYIESFKPGVPPMKQLFVQLNDGSGDIRARACYAKNVDKFRSKILQGKEYLIKNAKVDRIDTEKILILNGKTEVRMI